MGNGGLSFAQIPPLASADGDSTTQSFTQRKGNYPKPPLTKGTTMKKLSKPELARLTTTASELNNLLTEEHYEGAVSLFTDRFYESLPAESDALYEWLKASIENAVEAFNDGSVDDEIDVSTELLTAYKMMYVLCFAYEMGFARLVLRCGNEAFVSNYAYYMLMLLVLPSDETRL